MYAKWGGKGYRQQKLVSSLFIIGAAAVCPVTDGLYSGSRGWKLELLDIYRGQSRRPPLTVWLPNTLVHCPGKFEASIFFILHLFFSQLMLSGNKSLSSWIEEMPEDRFTTLPPGSFFVETQISDNKGSDRASFVSYLDPIQPSARRTAI